MSTSFNLSVSGIGYKKLRCCVEQKPTNPLKLGSRKQNATHPHMLDDDPLVIQEILSGIVRLSKVGHVDMFQR